MPFIMVMALVMAKVGFEPTAANARSCLLALSWHAYMQLERIYDGFPELPKGQSPKIVLNI